MIVKAYYSGGRIDVFDTDRMTDGIPQPGNLLTNYTLDLADVNGESLWLCSYYYEAADAYKEELGPKGLPVARRRDGWSFLIADAGDLQRLNRLTLDGETVLMQAAGELIDVAALNWAYTLTTEYPIRSSEAYDGLSKIDNSICNDEERRCSLMGMCLDTYRLLQTIVNAPKSARF